MQRHRYPSTAKTFAAHEVKARFSKVASCREDEYTIRRNRLLHSRRLREFAKAFVTQERAKRA
eukprot:6122547-Pleurochrysis_carterae.AAC.1